MLVLALCLVQYMYSSPICYIVILQSTKKALPADLPPWDLLLDSAGGFASRHPIIDARSLGLEPHCCVRSRRMSAAYSTALISDELLASASAAV